MPSARRSLGDTGEDRAVQALTAAGLTILARNWRCPAGGLDILAEELAPDLLAGPQPVVWRVCVEVRTRRGTQFGTAKQSITPRKQAKLREVAAHYIQSTGWTGPWRIDVVAVQMDGQGRLVEIEHIRHAVTG